MNNMKEHLCNNYEKKKILPTGLCFRAGALVSSRACVEQGGSGAGADLGQKTAWMTSERVKH